jgi:TAG lipase/steryl ester hydrolase/phospholipase A2/LPA acyltransferase
MVLEYLPGTTFCPDVAKSSTISQKKRRGSKSSLRQPGILAPFAFLKASVEAVSNAALYVKDGLTEEQRTTRRKVEERKQILRLKLDNVRHLRGLVWETHQLTRSQTQVTTLEEWRTAATELDVLEENDAWKKENHSDDFDAPLIQARLEQLDEARANGDFTQMLYLVRTALSRDIGGISNVDLYRHSHIGTKDLIERYIDSTLATIRTIVNTNERDLPAGMDVKDVLEQVVYARQSFGRSALMLSGGATFGMNHIGVLKALLEANLLPRIISGASAGSIVCAVLCTRTEEELPLLLEEFPHGDMAVFEDDDREDGLLERIGRFLTQGAWIDISHLTRVMKARLGDMTFQEAYNRTRRILNICVSSASIYELPRLLNYVTAPNVMIWSAVAASCSVPFVFSAAHLLAKNPLTGEHVPWNPTPQRWIDGSVDNDLPTTRLAEMFNVNHFIVSQVNPHVVPFLAKDEPLFIQNNQGPSSRAPATDWLYTMTNLAKSEALYRMQILADLGILPNLITKTRSILSQKYSGDITILPAINFKDFPRILKNPTTDFMLQACLSGERATWPKLSRIKNHCAVELELDNAVQELRARVVFSPSQVDLRRMSTGLTLMSKSLTGTRRRRVSGSNAITSSNKNSGEDDTEDSQRKANTSVPRPPLRTASSHFGAHLTSKNLPAPLATSPFTTSVSTISTASSERPAVAVPVTPPASTTARHTRLGYGGDMTAELNLTSETEAETTEDNTADGDRGGFASSDADIDSHTDESTPDVEADEDHNGLTLTPSQASLFPGVTSPAPQPSSPGLDRGGLGLRLSTSSLKLNATTPPSSVFGGVHTPPPMLGPDLRMTRVRERERERDHRDRDRPKSSAGSAGTGMGGGTGMGNVPDMSAGVVARQPEPGTGTGESSSGRSQGSGGTETEKRYRRIFRAAAGGGGWGKSG